MREMRISVKRKAKRAILNFRRNQKIQSEKQEEEEREGEGKEGLILEKRKHRVYFPRGRRPFAHNIAQLWIQNPYIQTTLSRLSPFHTSSQISLN